MRNRPCNTIGRDSRLPGSRTTRSLFVRTGSTRGMANSPPHGWPSYASHLTAEQLRDPYLRIFLDNDVQSLRSRVQQYWIELARAAVERRAYREAYHYYYRAGWDLGMLPISAYEEVFEQLQRVAEADGSPALAAIAKLHHRFLY